MNAGFYNLDPPVPSPERSTGAISSLPAPRKRLDEVMMIL
jgi:hypothetical protein